MNIIRIDSTPSTNMLLKELSASRDIEEGTVIITREQSSGRGQMGTSWESEPGKNLTFSLILYPKLPVKKNFIISQLTALSIKETLDTFTTGISIKWPNDIYFQDKKICGILIENNLMENMLTQSIIGIGLNINQDVFRSNAPNPVSLKQITGNDYDPEQLMIMIYHKLMTYYKTILNENYESMVDLYKSALYRKTGYHLFHDKQGEFMAGIENVDADGYLVLKTKEGELRRYAFKEIAYVLHK